MNFHTPALDAFPSGSSEDQRGVARPQLAAYDIGAIELWRLFIGVTAPTDLNLSWQNAATGCVYDVYEETG